MNELHDPGSGPGQAVDRRVAVLERIAQDAVAALVDIRAESGALRTETTPSFARWVLSLSTSYAECGAISAGSALDDRRLCGDLGADRPWAALA
jgi:hypothetical protein